MKISDDIDLLLFQLYLLWLGGCLDDADYLLDRLKRIIEAIESEKYFTQVQHEVNESAKNPVF